MDTTESLIPVDAAPIEASLPGYTDKDLTNSPTLGSSASSHGDTALEAHQQLHQYYPGKKHYADDPCLKLASSEATFRYVVLEDIRPCYARMAASHECDANFTIYRKYGWLHNRVLLHLQAELARLEYDLQFLDDEQAEKVHFEEQRGLEWNLLEKTRRKEMLAEIKTKLAEYDDLVFRLQKKNAMKRPTKNNQNSVLQEACKNFTSWEAQWTYRSDDLVALADDAAEQSCFNFVMQDAWVLAPRLFRGIFQSRERRIKTGSVPYYNTYSPIRIDVFYRAILTVAGTAIVLGSISVPSLLSQNPILTIYASTLVFSIFCAVFTKASRDQVFAATGGYCALQVMVMLLGPHMK